MRPRMRRGVFALRSQLRMAPKTNMVPLALAVIVSKLLYGLGGKTVVTSFPVAVSLTLR